MTQNWDDILGDMMEQARQSGEFDRHPNKGKPFDFGYQNPLADPSLTLAHTMLKESGVSLPWIEEGKAITAELEQARKVLARAWDWAQADRAAGRPEHTIEARWRQAVQTFETQVEVLNRRISEYNLRVPAGGFQKMRLVAVEEIAKVTGAPAG